MAIPRLLYAVAAVLLVLGVVMTALFLSERSTPDLGDGEVVVPTSTGPSPRPPATKEPDRGGPARDDSTRDPAPPGAPPAAPAPVPAAGGDDHDADHDTDDDDGTDVDD